MARTNHSGDTASIAADV